MTYTFHFCCGSHWLCRFFHLFCSFIYSFGLSLFALYLIWVSRFIRSCYRSLSFFFLVLIVTHAYSRISLCLCGMLFKPLNFLSLLKFMFQSFFLQCALSVSLFYSLSFIRLFIHSFMLSDFIGVGVVTSALSISYCARFCIFYLENVSCQCFVRLFIRDFLFIHSFALFVDFDDWLHGMCEHNFQNGGENSNTSAQR